MKLSLTIFLLCFFGLAYAQQVVEHSLIDCKKPKCDRKHKKVVVEYDSLSGLKIVTIKLSSGLNVIQFGGTTPKKTKAFQEIIISSGKRLKTCSSVSKFKGDVQVPSGSYISFDKQQPGFYVYHAPKLVGTVYTKRYDVTGNFIEKK